MSETEIENQVSKESTGLTDDEFSVYKARSLTAEEVRVLYPNANISNAFGIHLTQQEGFDRMLRNAAAAAEARKQQNRERIFARRSEQGE